MKSEMKTDLIKLQEVLYKKSLLEKEIFDAPRTLTTNIEILNKLKRRMSKKTITWNVKRRKSAEFAIV